MVKFTWLKNVKIGNYIRELSIVIIGVAVTFFVSDLISNYKGQKDLENQLNIVYIELEDNLKVVNIIDSIYYESDMLRKFLIENVNSPQPSTIDSINKYKRVANYDINFIYQKAAFDMFVNSGTMKMLTDRNLLLKITQAYAALEVLKIANDRYTASKRMIFNQVYGMKTADVFAYDIVDPKFNISYNFHALNTGMKEMAEETKERIDNVLLYKKK